MINLTDIVITGFFMVLGALFFLTRTSNSTQRGNKAKRGRRDQRRNDNYKLSRDEQRIYKQAKTFIHQKKFIDAARLLEQIGHERDAISILEKHGHIHEAANLLLRLGSPNRAGVIYARNRYYVDATKYFLKADMFLEAAICAKTSGDHKVAAPCFEKIGELKEAANCYMESGDFLKSARCHYKADETNLAIMSYKKGFLDNSIRHKDLTRQDKDNLSEWLSEGNFDQTVAQIAQACGLMQIVVKNLAKLGNTNYLSAILPHCSEDDLNQILAKINHEDGSGTTLASALKTFGDNARAGMIFEQLNLYEKAAICFEKALDFDRAAHLWGRAENQEKSKEAKKKAQTNPKKSLEKPASDLGNFALNTNPEHYGPIDASTNKEKNYKQQFDHSPTDELNFMKNEDNTSDSAEKTIILDPFGFNSGSIDDVLESDLEHESSQKHSHINLAEKTPPPKSFFHNPLWYELTGHDCEKIWNQGQIMNYTENDKIITTGDKSPGIFFILDGTVSAESPDNLRREYKIGQTFGEVSTLLHKDTDSTFTALTSASLWLLDARQLEEQFTNNGLLATCVYRNFIRELLSKMPDQQIDQTLWEVG